VLVKRISLLFVLLCLSGPVQSQSLPLSTLLTQAAAMNTPEQAWLWLQQHAEGHLNEADYNYALGVYASNNGNISQAINAFERTVLLQPDYAGAWLDLAIAYKQAGDLVTARELLDYVRFKLHPPTYLQPVIERFSQEWQQVQSTQDNTTYQLRTEAGYSTNPTSASTNPDIPLFLGQWTNLALIAEQRPHASPYVGVGIDAIKQWQGQQFQAQASVRNYTDTDAANQQQLWLNWLLPQSVSGSRWQVMLTHFDMVYSTPQRTLSLLRLIPIATDAQLTLGVRMRRYDQNAYDSNNGILALGKAWLGEQQSWFVNASLEQENPTGDRPGGAGYRVSATAGWHKSFTQGQLHANVSLSQYRDDQAYAAVIPIKRDTMWHQWRIQWTTPLSEQTQAMMTLQQEGQEANHPLFAWQDTQVSFGLAWRY
jgi:tetratricopeptide (TPR) repeat protein